MSRSSFRRVAALGAVWLTVSSCSRTDPDPARPAEPTVSESPVPALFRSSTSSGIDFVHDNGARGRKYLPEIMGSGGSALDYDGDGWIDLYLVQSGSLPWDRADGGGSGGVNRLFRNRGDGTFEDVTDRTGTGHPGYGMGSVAGDVDNDGDPDLYVVNFGADALLRNNGDGTFTEITREAGIDNPAWGSSASFADLDSDGRLDIYVANYLEFSRELHVDCGRVSRGVLSYCHPDVYRMAPDVAYRNLGGMRFEDATVAWGLIDTTGKGLGVVAADLIEDGRPDLYVANDATPNFLLRNRDGLGFEEVGLMTGVGYNEDGLTEAGMGTDAGDVDGDGRLDLLVTNLNNESNALYIAADDLWSHETRSAGLFEASFRPVGFGTDLADFDNDGDLDIVVVNGHVIDNIDLADDSQSFRQPGQLFLNRGDGRFGELSADRIGDLAVRRVGRGTITLDFDHDGRLDLLVTSNNEAARLLRHEGEAGNWLLVDPRSGSASGNGVGARVLVEAGGRRQIEEAKAGSSYQTSGDPRLHFGLGTAERVERVTIRWPDGRRQRLLDLPANRACRVGGR